MIDFNFVSPTKIFFGKDKEKDVAKILKEYGFARIFIVIGNNSVRKSGLLDTTTKLLKEEKIDYQIFEGVRANPTIQKVTEGLEILKTYQPDCILAIGGGSVIDTAKCLASNFYYDGDPFDFNMHKAEPKKCLPIGVILTIAAAGSELSDSCVIQNDDLQKKIGFNNDLIRPLFVIENPELTFSVSPYQTACGIVDIMMHSFGRYFSQSNGLQPSDDFAVTVIKYTKIAGEKVIADPNDYDARGTLMLMSSLSHNNLTSLGKKHSLFVHKLEHALSGLYPEVAHGAGLAVLWPKWARYYLPFEIAKFEKLGREVFDLKGDKDYVAKEFINSLERYYKQIGMPQSLHDLGINNPDIERLAMLSTDNGNKPIKHHIRDIDLDLARQIFEDAR